MKTAFKYIGLGLLAVIVLVMLIATTKPNEFRVERSRTIAAPADSLQQLLTDFHAWTRWSPYEALDPDMKRTYSGMPNGVGAVYSWEGKKAGSGRMEILSVAPGGVRIALDFTTPPVFLNVGHRPSQLAKCFTVGHFVKSVPSSLMSVNALTRSMPSIAVRSTPVAK